MFKKILSALTVLCLVCTLFSMSFSVSAAQINKGKIEIDKVKAITGDTVVVPVRITENPGIMAITISITYNSKALTYEKFLFGEIVNDYTVVAHPDKNIIRFVNCESRNRTKTGVLVYLQFKVGENAEADFYEIDINYSAGDFCNWDLDKIMPEIVAGGVEVEFNGKNCSHKKYGEWSLSAKPSCEENGLNQRVCKTCGHIDYKETAPIGHEYSNNWTIDQPATKEEDGIMTRYCIRCDDYVDRITFSLEQSSKGEIKNEINQDIPNNKFTEEIFKEQNPDKELTTSKPASNTQKNEASKNEGTKTEADSSNKNDKDKTESKESGGKTDKNTSGDKNEVIEGKDESAVSTEGKGSASDNNAEKEDNKIIQIIENLTPEDENANGEKISVIEKIKEVFPNFEDITDMVEIAFILFLFLVI